MSDQASAANKMLHELLAKELELVRSFKDLLLSEQASLVDGDVAKLPESTEQKNALVEQLNDLSSELIAVFARSRTGSKPSPEEVKLWIKGAPQETQSLWNSLLQLAAEIKKINYVNGKLINTRLQYTQQILSSLMGAANRANLYGPDGQPEGATQRKNSRGIIGKA